MLACMHVFLCAITVFIFYTARLDFIVLCAISQRSVFNRNIIVNYPVGKIAKKKQSEEVRFLKYTPTDCFFGNFAHWVTSNC